jgi:hypothetical protein
MQLCTGDPPAKGMRDSEVIILSNMGVRPKKPPVESCIVSHMSDGLWDIVSLCFTEDPSGRPTMSVVLLDLQKL